ncbi:hypothetical protein Tco_1394746 [Tanacetum coccineum]
MVRRIDKIDEKEERKKEEEKERSPREEKKRKERERRRRRELNKKKEIRERKEKRRIEKEEKKERKEKLRGRNVLRPTIQLRNLKVAINDPEKVWAMRSEGPNIHGGIYLTTRMIKRFTVADDLKRMLKDHYQRQVKEYAQDHQLLTKLY